MTVLRYTRVTTPIGPLLVAGGDEGLRYLLFRADELPHEARTQSNDEWIEDARPFAEAAHQLRAYFASELREFDLALDPQGTPFQLRVWQELRKIPYGETISYGELAKRIGNPRASRAVGLANGSNPISIIVPCHRVIGSDGKLTGYGGGLDLKARLLALERGQLALA